MSSNLHCLAFVLLKRSFAPKIWSNHCPRVQKVNLRLTYVAQKRPCINSSITAHLKVAREAGSGLCWTGHVRVPKNLSFQNEARCTIFLVKMFYLHENEKLFPHQRLSTYPRFETEARGNSEMAYYTLRLFKGLILTQFPAQSRNSQWKKR